MNNNNNYVIKECTAYCAISLFKKKDFNKKKHEIRINKKSLVVLFSNKW